MEYVETVPREGKYRQEDIKTALLVHTKSAAAVPSANVLQITLRKPGPSIGAIDGRKQGEVETMSNAKLSPGKLRLVDQPLPKKVNLDAGRADRQMASAVAREPGECRAHTGVDESGVWPMKTATARALENISSEPASPAGPRLMLVKKANRPPVRHVLAPWTDRDCLALALVTCNRCFGSGAYPASSPERLTVCNCVLRAVFRACYEKWRAVSSDQIVSRLGSSALSRFGRRQAGRRTCLWARPGEEYRADFELIARRALDASHFAIFRLHFVEGLDWKACCARLHIDRGNFFHNVYRIEQQLGKAYREAAPYALFPVYEYFSMSA